MLNHNVAKQILKPTHQHQISALIQTIRSLATIFRRRNYTTKNSATKLSKNSIAKPDQNTLQITTNPKSLDQMAGYQYPYKLSKHIQQPYLNIIKVA